MLHCFQCGADLPDNLLFCLHCGAKLEDDETETVVIPEPAPPPPIDIEPKTGGGVAKFVLGSLLGAVLVMLLLGIGVIMWISLRPDPPPANANIPVNKSNAESPQPSSSPSPRKPSPSPTPSVVNDNTEPGTTAKTCTINNPAGGSVNIRRNCDTRDCSMDPTTLYTQADPGETVEATSRKPVTTGRFTWVPVKYHGEVLWISSTRIDCD